MNSSSIYKIFSTFSALSKEPKTELNYVNNFTLAIAVILSAQATDISVNRVTKILFKNYTTPMQYLLLGQNGLINYIKSIGLYNAKAKNIIELSKILVDKYNADIPDNFEELISLPGIGRKTANVILNCAFGKAVIAVDTHVMRVSNRTGLSNAKSPEKIEADLTSLVPKIWLANAHNWLVLHGRYICKARKPECHNCPIINWCEWNNKTSAINL